MAKYLNENGVDAFLLEDGSGVLLLDEPVCYYLNENGTDRVLLEDGSGLLEMESCDVAVTFTPRLTLMGVG